MNAIQRIAVSANVESPRLRRSLTLPLLTLYGIGVTVGARIYVLIGAVVRHAAIYAPLAFVFAAIVMGLTVASYAELCARYPVAAGEAAYVRAAFRKRWISTLTGLAMIGAGVIATATVAIGATGYIAQFIDISRPVITTAVIFSLALVSAWGVLQSVLLACIFTIIEVTGLVLIVAAAWHADLPIGLSLLAMPPASFAQWSGIGFAGLLAFFAVTGFEEPDKHGRRNEGAGNKRPYSHGYDARDHHIALCFDCGNCGDRAADRQTCL